MDMSSADGMVDGARLDWICLDLEPAVADARPASRPGPQSPNWPQQLPEIAALASGRPDIIFLQGAKRFDADGDELLLAVERELGWIYRGFLTESPDSKCQQVIYVNTERLEAVHHWHGADPYEQPERRGFVEVVVDRDLQHPVLLKSIDLGVEDGNHRMAEARRILTAVRTGQRAVIAGCFTHGVLTTLLAAGWRDQHTTDDTNPPVTLHVDGGGELIPARCLTTPGHAIAARAEWIHTADTPFAHYRALGGVITIIDEESRI
jgi:hypothetical protein